MATLNSSGEHISGSLHIYVGAFALAKDLQNPLSNSKLELLLDLCVQDDVVHPVKNIIIINRCIVIKCRKIDIENFTNKNQIKSIVEYRLF